MGSWLRAFRGGGTGGRAYYTLDALLSLAALRRTGCRLPVELWHNHDPALLGADGRTAGEVLSGTAGDVFLRDFWSLPGGGLLSGFQLITKALLHASFEEVLYLDADNVPLVDPTPFFGLPVYRQAGAVFWQDFERVYADNPMWHVIGRAPLPLRDTESSQLLLNRSRHWKPLALCDYFNERGPAFYHWFLNGDAGLWHMAWLALSSRFHAVARLPGKVGYLAGGGAAFCGLRKFSVFPGDNARRWTALKRSGNGSEQTFPRGADTSECLCVGHGGGATGCSDLTTEVDRSPSALAALAQLAATEAALLQLRAALLDQHFRLVPSWWLPWAQHVRAS